MSTLITGAAGFVGLNLTEALLTAGRDVVVFDARPEMPKDAQQAFADLSGALTYVRGDVLDRDALRATLADHDVDTVVHAAVITPGPDRERDHGSRIVEVNLMGTMAMLDAAREHGVRRLVYPSSASVYGDTSFEEPRLEEATTHPVPNALYGIAKYAAERAVLRARELWGMDNLTARVGAVFGPWEHDTGLRDTLSGPMQASRSAVLGEEVVLKRPGPRDWVYAKDVADALIALLDVEAPKHLLYNISGPQLWTVADWCEKLSATVDGFSWRYAEEDEEPTIAVGDRDRSPLATERLRSEIYQPRFDLDAAFDDYQAWIARTSTFWTAS